MHQVSIEEATAHFPAVLKDVLRGEEIILTDRDLPVVKMIPLKQRELAPRRPGSLKGRLTIADDFDAPLEDFKDYMGAMPAILDTHAYLWYLMDDPRFLRRWHTLLRDRSNEIFVSMASLWEIAIKDTLGKLPLHPPFEEVVDSVEGQGFSLLPILPGHLIELHRLPLHHRDPFDRLIIAQSLAEQLPVLTVDSKFGLYGIELL